MFPLVLLTESGRQRLLDASTRAVVALGTCRSAPGDTATQSDHLWRSQRHGLSNGEGLARRPWETGQPVPAFVAGRSQTRIDFVVMNRLAHGRDAEEEPKALDIFFTIGSKLERTQKDGEAEASTRSSRHGEIAEDVK